MKGIIIILAILALSYSQEDQLRYISSQEASTKTIDQLIDTFASQQNQILRKIFNHFIDEQLRKWRKTNISEDVIRGRIGDFIVGRNPTLYANLKSFVEEKLFAKLDMHLLVESLQKEIRLNPENYYLTFEVYDLLID